MSNQRHNHNRSATLKDPVGNSIKLEENSLIPSAEFLQKLESLSPGSAQAIIEQGIRTLTVQNDYQEAQAKMELKVIELREQELKNERTEMLTGNISTLIAIAMMLGYAVYANNDYVVYAISAIGAVLAASKFFGKQ